MRIDPEKRFGKRACPGCATEVDANQNRCPICGYEFPHPTGPRTWVPVMALLMIFLIILLWVL